MSSPVIDSHCHAWAYWPYQPPVPDAESRGIIEQLLHEMEQNGVDHAFLVCAGIAHNPDNNDYIASQVAAHPDKIYQVADVDSSWSDTYHTPGAADRLRTLAERTPMVAFTHYLRGDDDGSWLTSDEGQEFFAAAHERGLLASIACAPQHHRAIRQVAQSFPHLPILLHHLGSAKVDDPAGVETVCETARHENVFIKLSGFYYGTAGPKWDYPMRDTIDTIVRKEFDAYGSSRLCWGSDYPVCRGYITFRQALEKFRSHCTFIPKSEHDGILGGNLAQLLGAGSV